MKHFSIVLTVALSALGCSGKPQGSADGGDTTDGGEVTYDGGSCKTTVTAATKKCLLPVSAQPLSSPRADGRAVAMGKDLVLLGGQTLGNGVVATGSTATVGEDGQLGPWREFSLPSKRPNAAAAATNDAVYFIGGELEGSTTASNEVLFATRDPNGALGEFKPTTALPDRRTLAAAAASGGKLFVVGGGTMTSDSSPKVFIGTIDPATHGITAWEEGTPLPAARNFTSAAVVGNHLYVVGGAFSGAEKACASQMILFAPITDGRLGAWAATTSLPKTPNGTLAASETHLFVVGGTVTFGDSYQSAPVGSVLAAKANADGTLEPWVRVGFLGDKRYQLMGAVVNGFLFAAGGRVDVATVFNDVASVKFNADGTLSCP